MSEGVEEKGSESPTREQVHPFQNTRSKSNEQIKDQSLFTDFIFKKENQREEPDIQVQELDDESCENMNFFSDSLFSSRTPRSGDGANFKNLLSSDLLRRIEEGSPIKSTKTVKKSSDTNLLLQDQTEDEETRQKEKDRESHSLFYTKKENPEWVIANERFNYYGNENEKDTNLNNLNPSQNFNDYVNYDHAPRNPPGISEKSYQNQQTYNKFNNFAKVGNYNNFTNFPPQTGNINFSGHVPPLLPSRENININKNFYPNQTGGETETGNFGNLEYSMNSDLSPKDYGFMKSPPQLSGGFNNYNMQNCQQNLKNPFFHPQPQQINIKNQKYLNAPLKNQAYNKNPTYEEFLKNKFNNLNENNNFYKHDFENDNDYYSNSNSTLSNSKKMSPFPEDVSFYPKSFMPHGRSTGNTPNSGFNYPNINPYQNSNVNSQNFNLLKAQDIWEAQGFNSFNENDNLATPNNTPSEEYIKSPLTLNLNINKIKKNANLENMSNLANLSKYANTAENDLDQIPDFEKLMINPYDLNQMEQNKSRTPSVKNYQNGKTGWICSSCKNFNYEIRVKCNRCGKPQFKNTTVQPTKNNNNKNNINDKKYLLSNLIKEDINSHDRNYNLSINGNKNNCKYSYNDINNPINKINQFNQLNQFNDNNVSNDEELIKNFNVNKNENIFDNSSGNSGSSSPMKNDSEDQEINFNLRSNKDNSKEQSSANKANSADAKKKKKPFVERVGDWVCIKCKNLNFSFRVVCNRCQLAKAESEKLFDQYMKNLMNYVKINELLQNQLKKDKSLGQPSNRTKSNLYSQNNTTDGNSVLFNGENYFTEDS